MIPLYGVHGVAIVIMGRVHKILFWIDFSAYVAFIPSKQ